MTDKKDEKKNEVATKDEALQLPSFVEPMKGGGLENVNMSDILIPRLVMMQGSSPKVAEGICTAGELYDSVEFTKIAGMVGDGPESTGETIDFIPCYHYKEWIHWGSRDKNEGMLAKSMDPKGALAQSVARGERVQLDGKDKFKVTEYQCFMSLIPDWNMDRAIVISCSSSQIKKAKQLLTLLRYRGKGEAPSFACKFILTTKRETKAGHPSYWNFEFENAGWVTSEEYEIGKRLHEETREGYRAQHIQVDTPEQDGTGTAPTGATEPDSGGNFQKNETGNVPALPSNIG